MELESGNHEKKGFATVDTIHDDEGVKVLAAYEGPEEWTTTEEKNLLRKIDRRLMPLLFCTWGLQFYDKALISQAALFGLRQDLELTIGNRYSMSASIFYLGFVCGAYPAMILAQRFPIERVLSIIVLIWGICMASTAGVFSYKTLYVQRFFLGFIEAGVSPAFMLIVGGWYKRQEQAFRMGIWYSAGGYTFMVSPLINYGIGHITGSLSSWRYMYIVAGCITILWSVLMYIALPPDPVRAKRFTDRERYIAVARLRVNNAGVRNTHFKQAQLWELLGDVKFWLLVLAAFCMLVSNGPLANFVPILINDMGFSGLDSLLLILPIGFVIGSIILVAPFCAMKFIGWRSWIIVITQCGTLLGSLLIWLVPQHSIGGRLFGVYILACYGGSYGVLLGLAIANTSGYTKRSLVSTGLYIGYCMGNFVGPLVFLEKQAPRYETGWIVCVVTTGMAIVLQLVYRLVCARENKRRDDTGELEAFEHAYEDDMTDKTNPQFRYTL